MPILNSNICTVFNSLCGYNIMTYPVYRCTQEYENGVTGALQCMCPAEFSSAMFNLKSSRVYPFVNVPFDKCINLYVVRDSEKKVLVNKVNPESLVLYEEVKCLLCDTTVGVIYKFASVAFLFGMEEDKGSIQGMDCPLVNLTEEEQKTHEGFLQAHLDEEKLPGSVTVNDVTRMRRFTMINQKWDENKRKFLEMKGLPYADRRVFYPKYPDDDFVSFIKFSSIRFIYNFFFFSFSFSFS